MCRGGLERKKTLPQMTAATEKATELRGVKEPGV